MFRKSLAFGFALTVLLAFQITATAQNQISSGPPSLALAAEPTVVKACADDSSRVQLNANARANDPAQLRYKWTTSVGKLNGSGPTPTWDLAGVQPGVYQAFVEVDDVRDPGCVAFSSLAVVVLDCPPPRPEPVCPTVSISCPEAAKEDAPVTFAATVSGGTAGITPIYNWTVSAGRIISGQGTDRITVDTAGLAGQTIRATLDVAGFGLPCPASCAVSIPIPNKSRKFDEYYDIARNDEKARLDNYAIQLQSEPGAQGHVIVYPSRKAAGGQAQARAQRITDYLVNSRGIDPSRIVITMGPARESWLFELWVVPEGALPPQPQR
jgi:hypothetical protein